MSVFERRLGEISTASAAENPWWNDRLRLWRPSGTDTGAHGALTINQSAPPQRPSQAAACPGALQGTPCTTASDRANAHAVMKWGRP